MRLSPAQLLRVQVQLMLASSPVIMREVLYKQLQQENTWPWVSMLCSFSAQVQNFGSFVKHILSRVALNIFRSYGLTKLFEYTLLCLALATFLATRALMLSAFHMSGLDKVNHEIGINLISFILR